MYKEAPGAHSSGGFVISRTKVAVLIDGGHVRALARAAKKIFNPDYIERVAVACIASDETAFRFLYYDCAPYEGTVKKPVSATPHVFQASDQWLQDLAAKDLVAVRRGVLKFRGWKPKKAPLSAGPTDADFEPDFEQKGVDMRIGLDMASFADTRAVDRIVLLSGDTDCVPAMKHVREAGLQVVIVSLPNGRRIPELLWHADFERQVSWP